MKAIRNIFLITALFYTSTLIAQTSVKKDLSPLSEFSAEWNDPVYSKCNTAKTATYMNETERQIIWILNLVRSQPQLFLRTVLLNPHSRFFVDLPKRNNYYNSLVRELKKIDATPAFLPDQDMFEKAQCHAVNSGKTGYVGHERKWQGCESGYFAECCSYGYSDPMDIVMQLLIDDGVPSLGHRQICLDPSYGKIGISIQPHTVYRYNAVLDLR